MSLSLYEQRQLAETEDDLAADTQLVRLAGLLDPRVHGAARLRRLAARHPRRRGVIVLAALAALTLLAFVLSSLAPARTEVVATVAVLTGLVLAVGGARWSGNTVNEPDARRQP